MTAFSTLLYLIYLSWCQRHIVPDTAFVHDIQVGAVFFGQSHGVLTAKIQVAVFANGDVAALVKTMDICHGNKQVWISDFVIKKAEELGFELIEKFILLSNLRLFARTRQQKVARKYHSYFFVFVKKR